MRKGKAGAAGPSADPRLRPAPDFRVTLCRVYEANLWLIERISLNRNHLQWSSLSEA
jgi:hypothetical protein